MRLFKFLVGTFLELVLTLVVAALTLFAAVGLVGFIHNLVS